MDSQGDAKYWRPVVGIPVTLLEARQQCTAPLERDRDAQSNGDYRYQILQTLRFRLRRHRPEGPRHHRGSHLRARHPHFDRHTSYVALSRHRDNATVFYASDDFGGRRPGATAAEVQARFTETLSRARPKELAQDYLELETGSQCGHGLRSRFGRVGEEAKSGARHAGHRCSSTYR